MCIFLGSEKRKPWRDPMGHQHSRQVQKRSLQRQQVAREDGGRPGAHGFPEVKENFSRWGLALPGAIPPSSSAHLGSTSSCQGPVALCQDRHKCTWGSGWRSEEQEGTGTHSLHWAGHSARRHLQLMAQREMGRESTGAQTGRARVSLPHVRGPSHSAKSKCFLYYFYWAPLVTVPAVLSPLFLPFFFLTSLLEYNCFTMVC